MELLFSDCRVASEREADEYYFLQRERAPRCSWGWDGVRWSMERIENAKGHGRRAMATDFGRIPLLPMQQENCSETRGEDVKYINLRWNFCRERKRMVDFFPRSYSAV